GIYIGGDDLGHEGGPGGSNGGAGGGQATEGGGLDIDPTGAGLVGQGEVAGVGRAGRQDDDAAGLGGIEGGLEIPAGGDRDGRSGREGVGGIEEDLGQGGIHGCMRSGQDCSPRRRRDGDDQQRG